MSPGASWFRVPPWCLQMHTEEAAPRARAWVYLLGAWHAGDDPSVREVRRVTGFGGGRADRLMEEVAAWAIEAGAAMPARLRDGVAGQERGGQASKAGHLDQGTTPKDNQTRGGTHDAAGQERGASRARDPLLVQKRGEEMVDLAPPVPVVAPAHDLPSVLKGDTTLTAPLAAAGITTLDALTAQTPTAVQMLNRVGPKRLAAIVAHLAEAGLALRAEPPKARKADTDRPGLRDLTDRWAGAYEHVTGRPYVWTPGGRRSDNKAARELYDALGWSAEPSGATVQRVRGVVSRYLRTRTTPGSHRVPTLADLAACLDQFAQDDHVVASAHKPRPVQVTKADQEREMLGGLETLFREARGVIATS